MVDTSSWVYKFKGELPEAGFEDQSLDFDLKGEGTGLIWTAAPNTYNSRIISECWDTAD